MTVELGRRPARGEARHQRRGRYDARAQRLEQLDDPVGDAIEVGHVVTGRDLHRDRLARDQLL